MTKRILTIIAATLLSLCAMAQSKFYVVMKDGSVQSYPSEVVDSLTFKNPSGASILGFLDQMARIDAMLKEIDSLKTAMANCSPNATHAYVDLGLPSGTLWATCNVGANAPEEYGDYFAWGETETKAEYIYANNKWYGVGNSELKSQGVIDANSNLTSKYDAATANWGSDWRMPTKDEINELISLTNEYVVENGVVGRKFIGTNGNTLFLPFAGRRGRDWIYNDGEYGNYWSASAREFDDFSAYTLDMEPEEDAYLYFRIRYNGYSVRPVLRTK